MVGCWPDQLAISSQRCALLLLEAQQGGLVQPYNGVTSEETGSEIDRHGPTWFQV